MTDILRRGRLTGDIDEDVHLFSSSMESDRLIFAADVMVDRAHVIMLEEEGIISSHNCGLILRALKDIEQRGIDALPPQDDVHIAIEQQLIKEVGEDIGGRMHSARSRNDEVAACIRLTLRDNLLLLMDEVLGLMDVLVWRALDHRDTLMPGFTHLQHAQPTTLAHHLMAHNDALARDYERLVGAYMRTNLNPLGAAAFASTGFPVNRGRTTELLGFDGLVENSMDAVATRDFLLESLSALTILMLNLSRIAEEIVLWSTEEFGYVELEDKYASTSSIMPQKKNPDIAELVRAKSGSAIGGLVAAMSIFKGLPQSYNRDLQEVTPHLWRVLSDTRAATRMMHGMIDTIKFNAEKLAEEATRGFTTATELADTIVRETGLPFRTAHQIVGAIARTSEIPSLEELDKVGLFIMRKPLSALGLTEEHIKDALDPMANIKHRGVVGGPAPTEMGRMIEDRRYWIAHCKRDVEDRREGIHMAHNMVEAIIQRYTGE